MIRFVATISFYWPPRPSIFPFLFCFSIFFFSLSIFPFLSFFLPSLADLKTAQAFVVLPVDVSDMTYARSKAFMLVLAAVGLVLVDMSVGFVVHNQPSVSKPTPTQSFATPQASATRPIEATGTPGIAVCSAALLATAAAGILARARRASGIVRKNYGDFQPIVYESHEYASDEGYLPDGTPINQAGNNSLKRSSPPVDTPPPPVIGSFTSQDSHYGIKFSYSMQKDAYADLEYLNDVGFLQMCSFLQG